MKELGTVRIIGGEFRGRKIQFPSERQVRPTPDRIRETLFNWLAPMIQGARCLDLFAGSGALGFEALSRGASEVVFVDNNREMIHHLQNTLKILKCTTAQVLLGSVPDALPVVSGTFDIVFLDPPFKQNLIVPSCVWLEQQQLIQNNSYIYLETERDLNLTTLPESWQLHRSKTAGQVNYHLAIKGASHAE